ncbi:AAA family ATPase [Dolichospermum circinale]|uniref:AAA family ATPase n=1 Tax=Dolichospermum circinale TaxID=109265 RepID=UPI00232DD953|nr:ATP-binding protein [Dolichospermum circinale]MDB9468478.1 ATP-binding protein [Dolichospermum circinale CS-539/09]MDB9470835.1 ATP-binding protein [Dolichospermum circinale CS-539]
MKIKFSNLGSIQETELDLRPLTVIIGLNNSNKTYIAYSTYGLWQRARSSLSLRRDNKSELELKPEEHDRWSLKIDHNLLDFFIRDIEKTAKRFGEDKYFGVQQFFQDSSRKLFSTTSFEMIISQQEVEDAINQLIQQDAIPLTDETSLKLTRKEDVLFFEIQPKNEELSKNQTLHLTNRFISSVAEVLFSNIFPFPAERNAFINIYKILETKRYRILKQKQRESFINSTSEEKFGLPQPLIAIDIRYPQPVEDFLDFLSEIELQETTKINSSNKNEFQKLADEIEKQLQNKNKTNLKSTKLGGKEIKVSVKRGLEIDLYNASSSIKQLAPLLLYLRYRASKGDFLVIDEPEMNLHPESQAKLLEALSILVNLGVRILLTTHSPYIMAHLNNLVNGNHENPKILKRQSSSLYLQDERAFLPMDKVSAYEMKDNKLVSLNDPDYGIRWDTLSDVSVDIQQKFFQIYEAGQEKPDEETEE